ncbi:class I SAM-dependent RNA methyltransferase [bacterium]|nr:class I SAM-dependent RNA methyltransferase [bacterium]
MTTFASIFHKAVRSPEYKQIVNHKDYCQTYHQERCTVCPAINFPYRDEISAKEKSFLEFWKKNNLPGSPEKMVISPLGRAYRTVSKRRVFRGRGGQVLLGLTDISESGWAKPVDVKACPIEPAMHASIYNYVQQFIVSRDGRALADVLSHVIIKGSYDEYWIIFNLSDLPQPANSGLNRLSKNMAKEFKIIAGLFYTIEEPSKYYLSDKAQANFKKLFGKDEIFQKVGERSFLYSPLAFSQTNGSIIEPMVAKVLDLMQFNKEDMLFDLYCGYGLFGLCAAAEVKKVFGMEISGSAIRSAIQNSKRNKIENIRFFTESVTAASLMKIFPIESAQELVILDPPRNGTNAGVIEFLAERRIRKALHLFCEVDLIPQELKRWTQNGYHVQRVVPLDMFPATESIETMVLLERN